MKTNLSPSPVTLYPNTPTSALSRLPARLERSIAARWKEWEPWVVLHIHRRQECGPSIAIKSAEFIRLRRRHSRDIVALFQAGMAMRLIRRHRLDDPRLPDDARAVLVRAALERRRTTRLGRRGVRGNRGGAVVTSPSNIGLDGATVNGSSGGTQSSPRASTTVRTVVDSQELHRTIGSIQKRVSEHFHLRELRDPDLRLRSSRRVFVFPRQVAMYLVRQVTGAPLAEIGREFGGRHHTTVMHSVNQIEERRRTDRSLNRVIDMLRGRLS